MAVGMLLAGPGVTRESYVQVTENMFGSYPMRADQAPDGLITHSAGDSEQGWYVYDIWESRDHFQRFLDQKLGPALAEMGGDGDEGERPTPQFFEIEVLVSTR